ncbi:Nn.00g024230.m01.CDS01 [Neocucurbitaria sp. VM-36]
MSSRSLGELLLRPSSFPRIPSTCSTQCIRRVTPSWTAQRCISNTPNHAAQPQRKEDAYSTEQQDAEPQQRQQPRQASQAETSQAIDSLFSDLPTSRPQQYYAPRKQTTNTTSSDELRAARASHVFGSEFSNKSRTRPSRRPPGLNFDNMALPDDLVNPSLPSKPSEASSLATQQEETFANYPRLNPTYGRTVDLDASRGRDIVRGIGMLGSLMARNKVKSDFNKQRFHERGGLKRKRLNSERWRARFKKGFQEVTGRVSELTRKGW